MAFTFTLGVLLLMSEALDLQWVLGTVWNVRPIYA